MSAFRTLALMLALAQVGCLKSAPQFSETALSAYQKDGIGGFSPYWIAYIDNPSADAKDRSSFVTLNGKRLGPYSGVSGLMKVSRDGKHLAFAAEKEGHWIVVVDGVEKFTHKALLWPWSAWSPSLEGNSYIPQTRAAVLEFSRDGQSIAYPAETEAGKYAMFVNGKAGPVYTSVGSDVSFIGDRVKYFAFPAEKKIVEVHGNLVLGPYDSSYATKVSPDGGHYAFWAKKGDKSVIVVDDQERGLPGPLADYVIGDKGFLAYAYKSPQGYRVRVADVDIPGAYDEVADMTVSPDNRKVAYWASRGGKWTLFAGERELAGFDGYFYYQAGGRKYSVMWSPDSQHVAYYVRANRGGLLVLDGRKLDTAFTPPGLALQVIVDDQGQTVGTGLMQGPQMDTSAFVQAVLMRDKIKCDPFPAALFGPLLSFIEKKDSTAYMHIGDKTEGPFQSIRSTLFTSAQSKHYAYIIETEKGQQFVVDGAVSSHAYDAIYRPVFNEDNGSLVYLALKGGSLVRVVQPF